MKVFGIRFSFSRTIGFIGVGKMGVKLSIDINYKVRNDLEPC
jgi:hypothetical protein